MTAALVIDAINMAAWTRRHTTIDGLICHTDAGSQYTSILYTERLDDVGAAPSIGTVGDSFDNAMAESVMGLFKTELHRNPAASRPTAAPGRASTTSNRRRVAGSHGSTRSDCTQSSATARRPKPKSTTVKDLSPMWHEKTKPASLHQTQAGSLFGIRPRGASETRSLPWIRPVATRALISSSAICWRLASEQ